MKPQDYRKTLVQRTREAIRTLRTEQTQIGREIDSLTQSLRQLENERKRRSPQIKAVAKPKPKSRRKPARGKAKGKGKKPINGSGSITTRGKLEDLFAREEVLTISQAEQELGINHARYHFSNLRDDRLIAEAGLAPPPKGGGKAEARWRWLGPPARELAIVAGAGTRAGRKKAVAP